MSLSNQRNPYNLLYTNTPTYLGGAEVSILTLMRELDRDRFTPRLLTTSDGDLSRTASQSGIKVTINPLPGLSRRNPLPHLRGIRDLTNLVRQERISLIHTNCDSSLLPVRYAAALNRVPFVSHIRDFVRGWFTPVNLRVLHSARAVIAISAAVARACTDAGLDPERVVTIYDPIDVDTISSATLADRTRFRAEFNIPQDATVLGIVGQIQAIKGHREFMRVAMKLAARERNLHFLIVGTSSGAADQQFATEMRALAYQSPFSELFHYTGFRSDIPAVMKSTDILTVPSWTEAFGRVVVEGMAAGCAVIGTRVGGIPEIITDEQDGCLIPSKDAVALEATLDRLIHQPELRLALGAKAITSSKRFAVEKQVRKVEDLYSAILKSTAKRNTPNK